MSSADDIDTADVLQLRIIDGEARLVVGDSFHGAGFGDNLEFYSAGGFISFPNLPTDEGACQVIYVRLGNQLVAFGTKDNRIVRLVGAGEPGDCMIVSDCTSRLLLKRGKDTISLYAANQQTTPVGQTMTVQVDAQNGVITIMNGGAVFRQTSGASGDEVEVFVNGGGSLRIHKGGVEIRGGDITLIGGLVRLGDAGGGNPTPPTPANAVAIGPGGPVNIVSPKVFATLT